MTTLADNYPTLLDVASRTDPDGAIAGIAEIMDKEDEVLLDIPFIEANGASTHETTARTGIPAPTWRQYYGFVQPTKSTTVKVRDSMGMMEAFGEIDCALANRQNNRAGFIATENRAKVQGFAHDLGTNVWYGNEKLTPEKFTGLAPRFNSLSTAVAKSAANVINATGATNCTSLWLIGWGEESVHGIYPQGSKAGLEFEDLGEETKESTSGLMRVYRQWFKQTFGMSVRDWRYIVRICNIDVTALTKNAATGADLVDLMTQAQSLIHKMNGRVAYYGNRRVWGFLRRQMVSKVFESTLTYDTLTGPQGTKERVLALDGIPIRRCDSLLNTETAVA